MATEGPTNADFNWSSAAEERAAGWPGAQDADYQDPGLTAALLADEPTGSAWSCPVEHPWRGRPQDPTIEWDGDVATCLWRGCWRRSDDPVPRGECFCEGISDVCTGQCCGPGQCSCSWPADESGGC